MQYVQPVPRPLRRSRGFCKSSSITTGQSTAYGHAAYAQSARAPPRNPHYQAICGSSSTSVLASWRRDIELLRRACRRITIRQAALNPLSLLLLPRVLRKHHLCDVAAWVLSKFGTQASPCFLGPGRRRPETRYDARLPAQTPQPREVTPRPRPRGQYLQVV